MNTRALLIFWLVLAGQAWGYVYSGDTAVWQPGPISFQIKLGSGTLLQDGTNHSTSVQAAMTSWNAQLGTVQFAPTIVAQSSSTDPNHDLNEIVFSGDVEGDAYGDNVLAITLSYTYPSIHERSESDIFFNTAYTWNSYRGSLHFDSASKLIPDIRRVALHELGHVLGLDHPDERGQSVTAVMNSTISDSVDALTTDDIAGAQGLYRGPGNSAPAANNDFANATAISLINNGATVTGTTYFATKEAGEPNHAGVSGGRSVWWKWTAPMNGSISLTTQGSYFDTLLGVYTGSAVSTLSVVASNDQATNGVSYSSLTFNAISGTTYFIAVDGWNGESGFVSLGLTFVPAVENSPPAITGQPSNQTVNAGQTTTFSVSASGTPAPSYQWQRLPAGTGTWSDLGNGGSYTGVTTATLTITGTTVGMSGDQFRCVATNVISSATSNAALLMISAQLTFTVRPLSKLVVVGQSATFSAAITGTATTYQWKRNGQAIAGAAGLSYSIANVALTDDGYYELTASNAGSSVHTYFYLHVAIPNGAIVAWGDNRYGQSVVPYGLGNAAAVSAEWHNLLLRTNGTVVAWGGSPSPSALDVPAGLTNVVEVSAGNGFSLALKSDGTVVAWGDNYAGRTTVPPGLTDVIAISASTTFSVALKADGTVTAWGYGGNSNELTTVPAGLSGVVAIDTGQETTVALKSDGTLVAWGRYGDGLIPVPASLSNVAKFACSSSSVLALKQDGTLFSWGGGMLPSLPAGLSGITAVAAGTFGHGLARKSDGTVVAWGYNGQGQTNVPNTVVNAVGVYAGNGHSLAIVPAVAPTIAIAPNGTNVTQGTIINFSVSVTGPGPFLYVWTKDGSPVTNGGRISGASSANLQIVDAQTTDAGSYRVTITNMAGTVVSSPVTLGVSAKPVITARPLSQSLVTGQTLQASVTASGTGLTYLWRHNGDMIPGATTNSLTQTNVTVADAGYYEVLVTNSIGGVATSVFEVDVAPSQLMSLVAWGYSPGDLQPPAGGFKALGGNAVLKTDSTVAVLWGGPPPPSGLTNVVAVSGYFHYLALKADGTVVAWGNETKGQTVVPLGLNEVVAVSAGSGHSVALKADGTVVAWGLNANGQCNVPANLIGVVAISAGSNQTVALKSDGTVVAWGQNTFGEAPGDTGIANAKAISAGWLHNLVLRRDGTVTGFGSGNDSGQLNVPAGLTNVVAVSDAMGDLFSMAVKADGTVVQWGSITYPIPTDLSGVVTVTPGRTRVALTAAVTAPTFLQQPASRSAFAGYSVTLSAVADGWPMVAYQWYLNGTPIVGATRGSYTIGAMSAANAGSYTVVASNSAGSATSSVAQLVVSGPSTSDFNGAGHSDFNGDGHSDILWLNTVTGERDVWFMNGSSHVGDVSLGIVPVEWAIAATADFNGDGQPDLLWQNTTTGERYLWFMNGSAHVGDASLGIVPVEWAIAAAADFNGDGNPDILWQNTTTGERYLWFMIGSTHVSDLSLGVVPVERAIAAAADFNGDGNPDILWQNTTTGERYLWFMIGSTHLSDASLGIVPVEWAIAAAADFNGDGNPDILWQNTITGERYLWFMNGPTHVSDASLGLLPAGWSLAGVPVQRPLTSTHDFNGDGKADILWQNTTTGERYLWFMNGSAHASDVSLGIVPTEWSIATTADFNGDGKPDILWQNAITGQRYLWFMNGSIHVSDLSLGVVPPEWSIATAADFNGDGKPDLLWQNAITGQRYLWFMNGSTHVSDLSLGVVPPEWSIVTAADFNGDSKPDLLWQNTTSGERYLWFMNGSTHVSDLSLGVVPREWSIVTAADFNGDGKPDILWQNTTTGERYLWFMNGPTHISDASLGIVPTEWKMRD